VRDYIHVSDVAHAHLAAARGLQAGAPSATYNIGRGEGFSVLEVLRTISEVTGLAVDHEVVARRAGDPARVVAAVDQIRAGLGFTAVHDLQSMVSQPGRAGSCATGSSEGYRTRSGRFAGTPAVVDLPSARNRFRAAHRCVECCRSARCAGRGCGSLMLLDANLLLYAVDRTSPPVRVERALTGPAVFLAEQVRLRGASRTAAAAVLPLAGLAAIVVAGPVRVLSQIHISRSRHQHSSKDYTPRTSRGYSSDASFGAAWQGHTLALPPRWTRT